jgi:hypothetical protein
MDARTERLLIFTDAMAWFTDDDTDAEPDLPTNSQFPRRKGTTRPIFPIRPDKPSTRPPLDLMERVLDGLNRKTWPSPEGDSPDEPDN